MTTSDSRFAGSVPAIYERCLVPLIFRHYADDLTARVLARRPGRVLEIAAGTGVVTRAMAAALGAGTAIVATDLNQAMIDEAVARGGAPSVEWKQADAMRLPFPDASFDAVVCQFGVMFFPDRAAAYAETRRVLKPGGAFLFSAWDRIEDNEFADVITAALRLHFPADPPLFLARTPHGYHDAATIRRDLAEGGFAKTARVDVVAARSVAESARVPAMGFCQGSPLRLEIEARDAAGLEQATDVAAKAVERRFGTGRVDAKMQALVVSVER